jgi:hypothetical protein
MEILSPKHYPQLLLAHSDLRTQVLKQHLGPVWPAGLDGLRWDGIAYGPVPIPLHVWEGWKSLEVG